MNINFIKLYVFIVGLAWTVICGIALYSYLKQDYREIVSETETRARTILERDTFILDIVEDQDDRVIVSLITGIAEGVEELAQRDLLIGMNCRAMQGFYFSKPLPADDFPEFVAKRLKVTA